MTDPRDLIYDSDVAPKVAPVLKMLYTYQQPFLSVAQGFLHKYSYEPRSQLTTFTGVEQLDEDRFMFYRRVDSVYSNKLTWERVVYDRREGGKITSELVQPLTAQLDKVYERGTLQAEGNGVTHTHDLIEHQGIKSVKVEMFKTNVEKVLKAIRFLQYDQQ